MRIRKHYSDNDPLGTCIICEHTDIKVVGNICKKCNKALTEFEYNIDTLKNAVLYLEDNIENK